MSISTIIAEFTAEPAEFTGEAMYLAKRSILEDRTPPGAVL